MVVTGQSAVGTAKRGEGAYGERCTEGFDPVSKAKQNTGREVFTRVVLPSESVPVLKLA